MMRLPSNPGADPGIPSWCRVGAKVVYVGTNLPTEPGAEDIPDAEVGAVYTINWTGLVGHQFCVGCVELSDRGAWDYRGFRPLITQEDDLGAHFRVYLKDDHRATRREGVDA